MKKTQSTSAGRMAGLIQLGLALCCASFSHAADYYDVTDLGLPAGSEATRTYVNDSGVVAGAYIAHLNQPVWTGSSWTTTPTYGYVWFAGVLTTLPLPSGAQTINIAAISNGGVLGSFYDGASHKHYFTYQAGVVSVLTPAGAVASSASSINAEGDVLGAFYGPDSQSHAFIFHNGSLVDLTPAGAVSSQASAVTADGRAAGYYYDSGGHVHAFVWANGAQADLSVPVGTTDSFASAVNAVGQVAGSYKTASGQTRACVWTNGVFMDIGVPVGATAASPNFINDAGELAGSCWGFNGGDYHLRGFVWRGGAFTVIHLPGANDDYAQQIFSSGAVLGGYSDGSGGGGKFIYVDGVITLLNPTSAQANSISEVTADGQIAGYYVGAGVSLQPYIYQNNTFSDFAALGHPYGESNAINANGEVVGTSGYSIGFLVAGGVFKELSALVDSAWTVTAAWDINASGKIAAHATVNGVERAVLLTPAVPPLPTPTPTPTPTPPPPGTPTPTPSVSPTPVAPPANQTEFPAKVTLTRNRQWIIIPIKAANAAGISSLCATLKGRGMASITNVWNVHRATSFSERWKLPIGLNARKGAIPESALKQGLRLELRTADAVKVYPVRLSR